MSILEPLKRRSRESPPGFMRLIRKLTPAEFARHLVAIRAAHDLQVRRMFAEGVTVQDRHLNDDPARVRSPDASAAWMARYAQPIPNRRLNQV